MTDTTTEAPGGDTPQDEQAAEQPRTRTRRRRCRRPRPRGVWRVVSVAGWTLVWTGIVILLFVAYTLWGTRLMTLRAQNELRDEFEQQVVEQKDALSLEEAALLVAEMQRVRADGDGEAGPIARVRIPKIGVDTIVVVGTDRDDLRKGPGLFDETALPGLPGNSVVSGHRTTYGAEFNRVDELEPGDEIHVTTLAGESVYRMSDAAVVRPKDVWVAEPTDSGQLTLTSCHPKFSARERYVVFADLVDGPFAEIDQAALVALTGGLA